MGNSKIILIASLVIGLAVALGAFGAHVLRDRVEPYYLGVWEKAVLYQLVHGIALLIIPILGKLQFIPEFSVSKISLVFLVGIVLFSGSLYFLVLTGMKWLGAITPLGGVSFLIGWTLLAIRAASNSGS